MKKLLVVSFVLAAALVGCSKKNPQTTPNGKTEMKTDGGATGGATYGGAKTDGGAADPGAAPK